MMMSPEVFAEEYRNEPIEEIKTIRNELIGGIKDLEKIVFRKIETTMHGIPTQLLMFNIK